MNKVEILEHILNSAPENSFYEFTDYCGYFNHDEFRELGIEFTYLNSFRIFKIQLSEKNTQGLLSILKKLDFFPMAENHVSYGGKKILESYDGFDAGIMISSHFDIDKTIFLENNIYIGYLD